MANKLKNLVKYLGGVGAVSYASAAAAMAQANPGQFIPGSTVRDNDLIVFAQRVLNLAIGLAGLVAVGFLVYSGIQYILAAGDDGKVQKATAGITYSIIGLVVCFIAVLIVNFVLQRVLQV